jgi:hypothetical protein
LSNDDDVASKVEALARLRFELDSALTAGIRREALEHVFEQQEKELLSVMNRDELLSRARREIYRLNWIEERFNKKLDKAEGRVTELVARHAADHAAKFDKLFAEMEELKSRVQTLERSLVACWWESAQSQPVSRTR